MISHLLAACVGCILAVAGANKIVARKQWMADASAQGVWPLVAYPMPFVELLLGALLIGLTPTVVVLGAATTLLLIFTAFLVVQIVSKSNVPCACFGTRSRRPPSQRDVLRNLAMMVLLFMSAALQ